MAVNHLTINIPLPVFTGRESTTEQIRLLREYLFQLVEHLNYTMENLGVGNWNEKEMEMLTDSIAQKVLEKLQKQ